MSIDNPAEAMERNVRLYPWYAALFNAFFWMPVFFLYFGAHLPLSKVLLLEGIYYLGVVVLEVPSGYLSDRLGRKPTLIAASVLLVTAYVTFFLGASFVAFALAQVLLAGGIALNSGTDTSFHFDSLAAADRDDEYGQREAVAARWALTATALAALGGGLVASVDLSYAYGLSVLAALCGLALTFRFTEPEHGKTKEAARFFRQLKNCLAHLKRPALAWLFGFAVFAVVINHVPYEFYQPYFDILGLEAGQSAHTPLAAGVHAAVATLLAAWVAGHSARIAARIGTAKTLLLAGLIQLVVIAAMASVLHLAIAALLVLRGVPSGLYKAPLHAAVTPRIPQAERATYLSIQSLAGRLGFSVLWVSLSLVAGGAEINDWPMLSQVLWICTGVAVAGLVALAISAWRLSTSLRPSDKD